MTSRTGSSCVVRLAVPLLAALSVVRAGYAQQAPPPFTEVIDVREVGIVFDPGVLPPFESMGKKEMNDFAAFEGGSTYPLVALAEVPAEDWVHLIWFDPVLAGAASRTAAANELVKLAGSLTGGALVEVVVADPKPRLLVSTRDRETLRHTLSEIAASARPKDDGSKGAGAGAEAERTLQLDRLAGEIARRAGGGARALWLPVDGWALAPAELERLERSLRGEVATDPVARSLAGAARTLAGYGWITFPLALREADEKSSPSDAERRLRVESGGTGDERTSFPVFSVSGSRGRQDPATDAQLDTLTDMTLLPLAELARTTSGALIGHEARLRDALSNLRDRKRATYRAPRPRGGDLVPVEVRWRGGDGRALPAPKLLRSGAPAEVSRARLRLLLAGDAVEASETIQLRKPTSGSGNEICFGAGEKRPVRISFAREAGNGEVTWLVGEARELAPVNGNLCAAAGATLAAGDRRLAWIAEDLDTDAWTGGVETAR
jgi:hypothetical protein